MTRQKRQDEHGRWSTAMTVHDTPQDATQGDESPSATEDGFPGVGQPGVGELGAKPKTVTENGEDLKMVQGRASRRAHASGERATRTVNQVILDVRTAVAREHGQQEADDLSDEEALGLYFTYVGDRGPKVRDLVAYLAGIFSSAPYTDTFLSNSESACTRCQNWESECRCPVASAA